MDENKKNNIEKCIEINKWGEHEETKLTGAIFSQKWPSKKEIKARQIDGDNAGINKV